MIPQLIINGLLMGGIYSLVAIGMTLILGVTWIFNFSHGVMLMLGMYTSYWCYKLLGIDPYLSVVVVIPLFFIIGAAIQKFLLNRIIYESFMGMGPFLLTLGLLIFIENFALMLWGYEARPIPVSYASARLILGTVSIHLPRLIAVIVCLVASLALYLFLRKTDTGLAIRAISTEREGAQLVGINVYKIYYIAFGIGTLFAALGGVLISVFQYVSPHIGAVYLMLSIIVVVLGGMGSIFGAFIGGLIIGVVESLASVLLPWSEMGRISIFIIFVLILIFRPTGLLKE